jgi:uncharacterized protein YneF (UPF0154 family)
MNKLKNTILICLISCATIANGQSNLFNKASKTIQKNISKNKGLSEQDVKLGLSEALEKGSKFSVKKASAIDGFNANPKIRIPIPAQANKMKETLVNIGFEQKVNEFEVSINRAAESASKEALKILIQAIKNMSIRDAFSILKGEENSATIYLRKESNQFLYQSFKPIVINCMKQVEVAKKWNTIATKYNSIPLTKKVNPDLEDYITNKAIDGLFVLIAQQEKEIRKNPMARTSDILKKVFEN